MGSQTRNVPPAVRSSRFQMGQTAGSPNEAFFHHVTSGNMYHPTRSHKSETKHKSSTTVSTRFRVSSIPPKSTFLCRKNMNAILSLDLPGILYPINRKNIAG